jgi:hypothetical protein
MLMPRLRGTLRRIAGEPLVHFLLIGTTIFGLFSLTARPEVVGAGVQIVISSAEIERLASIWEQRWKRRPTSKELEGLVEERIREEVYYREALALGLDRDDVAIRRLMQRKLEFVTRDILVPPEPTTAELTDYYDANVERYSRPPLLSFTQIYFSVDQRGGAADKDARALLARLNAGMGDTPAMATGDGQLFPGNFEDQTPRDIEAVFGPDFAASLAEIEAGTWSGPVASAYGLHLVRIDARRAGEALSYPAVADKVRADWDYEQGQKANDGIYRSLRARYEVIVEPGALPQAEG